MSEADVLSGLKTARQQIVDRIVEVTENPKPSYREGGREYKWAEYLAELRKQLGGIQETIQQFDGPDEGTTFAKI